MSEQAVAKTPVIMMAATAILLIVTGCSGWKARSYPDYLQQTKEAGLEHVRLTLHDVERIEIWNAHVEGDSLVGVVKQEREGLAASSRVLIPNEAQGPRIAVAIADIEKLEVENRAVDIVVLVAVLAAFIAVTFVYAASTVSWN